MDPAAPPWGEKAHVPHGGSRYLVTPRGGRRRPQLLLVWLAALLGTSWSRPDGGGPRNLLCYKSCCGATFRCLVNCSWEAGPDPGADYSLRFRYQDKAKESGPFAVGKATSYVFDQNAVYALKNVTIWVESRAAGGPLLTSENLTLQLSQALKFEAPPSKLISFSRANHFLTLTWPVSHNCRRSPMKKEVRMRRREGTDWAQGKCASGTDDKGTKELAVTCHVEENVPYEVQIRYRTSDWSSYWSDWSQSVFVPAEILRSPQVNFTAGRLGEDGLRMVALEWEKPSAEQGGVNYTLTLLPLPCQCDEDHLPTELLHNITRYQTGLAAAGYNVSLWASNEAGKAPARSFQLPPARDAGGASFLNVTLRGNNFTLKWEAKTDADLSCFEQLPLGKALPAAPCAKEELRAGDVYQSSGTLEPNTCYRLAVHGFDPDMGAWSTFGFTHLFLRNVSLEAPIHINVTVHTAGSAVVRWEPPEALATCPGVLEKYVICCQKERDGHVSYHEANASETHYAVLDLQPRAAYRVGVWAHTAGSKEACRALFPFVTSPPDPKHMPLALYLGVFGGLLAACGVFHFGRKRVKKVLFPPLPNPANTQAVKILSAAEAAQAQPLRGFMQPLETSSLAEPFVVEVSPTKEEPAAGATVDSPLGLAKAVQELPLTKEDWAGSSGALPCEYKAQGLLSPAEEDWRGREGLAELAEGTGSSLLPAGDTGGGDGGGQSISFCLLDKLVVTDGGFGFSGNAAAATVSA